MLLLPIDSGLHKALSELATKHRMVFMAGLPGTGKSLMIQQLSLLAHQAGRRVHLLQWDMTRRVFDLPELADEFPEIDGVTHPAVRKAVGLWARDAVVHWDEAYPEPEHILIGELPLIGNRLIEMTQRIDDSAEILLSSNQACFVVPVPSWEVREVIEKSRERSIAEPQNEREKLDAPPNVLRNLWKQLNAFARDIGLTKAGDEAPFNPYIYGGVYEALLQHRNMQTLTIEKVLRPERSVYDLDVVESELFATKDEVLALFERIRAEYTPDSLEMAVANWHATISANPKPIDRGPELMLPLPEGVVGSAENTTLTEPQLAALRAFVALPIDAPADDVVPLVDAALATLTGDAQPTLANVKKFDVFDGYFNVTRIEGDAGTNFIAGLLQAYRNVVADFDNGHTLTVIEMPMLRVALETTLRMYGV